MSREGFVLAGGSSRRMGRDKALTAWQMPLLEPSVPKRMLERHSGDGLMAVSTGGRAEPLCAVYHRRLLDHVRVNLDQNRRKASEVVETIDIFKWQIVAEMAPNWNTPNYLAARGSAPGQ